MPTVSKVDLARAYAQAHPTEYVLTQDEGEIFTFPTFVELVEGLNDEPVNYTVIQVTATHWQLKDDDDDDVNNNLTHIFGPELKVNPFKKYIPPAESVKLQISLTLDTEKDIDHVEFGRALKQSGYILWLSSDIIAFHKQPELIARFIRNVTKDYDERSLRETGADVVVISANDYEWNNNITLVGDFTPEILQMFKDALVEH